MNYLQLVQSAMKEAGITGLGAANEDLPISLVSATGMTARFKDWVSQAWQDIQIEEYETEFRKTWFSTTLNPRFYYDLDDTDFVQPSVGDILVGDNSGTTLTVSTVYILNGGTFTDGSAQGLIDFTNITGTPFVREIFTNQTTGDKACRWIRWGDYQLMNQDEMGNAYVDNLEDLWYASLKIQSIATASQFTNELPLPFCDFSKFLQNFDLNNTPCGRPILVTETPDDGTRLAFYPPLDQPYSLQGYYYKGQDVLVDDTDEPTGLKQMYHPMIFWRAVSYYGKYENQPGIQSEADSRYVVYKKRLDKEGELPIVLRPMAMY